MRDQLTNKVIVITGGNSGIGYATAKKVISAGGHAIIVAKTKKTLDHAINQLGNKSTGYIADISKLNEIENIYKQIKNEFHNIHGVVINAGIAIPESCENVTEESFNSSIGVNLKGAFFTAQKAIPVMQEGGSIVFVSSASAYRAFNGGAIYSATKAAVRSLASTLAIELAPKNIRSNSVSPGTIITPIFEKLGLTADQINITLEKHKEKIPLERCGKPDEVANVIAFLLSDESSYLTGSDILADGGLVNCLK